MQEHAAWHVRRRRPRIAPFNERSSDDLVRERRARFYLRSDEALILLMGAGPHVRADGTRPVANWIVSGTRVLWIRGNGARYEEVAFPLARPPARGRNSARYHVCWRCAARWYSATLTRCAQTTPLVPPAAAPGRRACVFEIPHMTASAHVYHVSTTCGSCPLRRQSPSGSTRSAIHKKKKTKKEAPGHERVLHLRLTHEQLLSQPTYNVARFPQASLLLSALSRQTERRKRDVATC